MQAQAPPVPAGPLTLEQVLALAEARSESIALAQSGVRRAEADQVRAHSGLLPQLSASGSYDRALASEFSGVFDNGSTTAPCAGFGPNQAAPLESRVAELERALDCGAAGQDLLGGTPSVQWRRPRRSAVRPQEYSGASLTFSQNLYSGGRNGAQDRSRRSAREPPSSA